MHLFIAWNCRNAIVYRPLRTSNNTCWSPNSAGGGRCAKTRRTETEGEFDQQLNSSCSSSSLPLLFSHRRLRISSAVSRISHQALSLVSVCLCWSSSILSLSLSLFSLLSPTLVTCLAPVFSPDWKSTQFAQTAVSLLSHSTQRERCSLDLFSYCFALSPLLYTALIGNYTFFFFLFSF